MIWPSSASRESTTRESACRQYGHRIALSPPRNRRGISPRTRSPNLSEVHDTDHCDRSLTLAESPSIGLGAFGHHKMLGQRYALRSRVASWTRRRRNVSQVSTRHAMERLLTPRQYRRYPLETAAPEGCTRHASNKGLKGLPEQ